MSETHRRILQAVADTPALRALASEAPRAGAAAALGGVSGSAGAAAIAALHARLPHPTFVAVAADPGLAQELHADLMTLLGDESVGLYPQREALPYERDEALVEVSGPRVEAVEALVAGRCRLLVTTTRALQEKEAIPSDLERMRIELAIGEEHEFGGLIARLEDLGFERSPIVEEVGQFAVRGGLMDVFAFGVPEPVRIEFWGDEITSMRFFDVLDQRSTAEVESVRLLPANFEPEPGSAAVRRSLLELLPRPSWLIRAGTKDWMEEARRTWSHVDRVGREYRALGREVPAPDELMMNADELASRVDEHFGVALARDETVGPSLGTRPPPPVDRDMKRLARMLDTGSAEGWRTIILCDNRGQLERLDEILCERGPLPRGTELAVGALAHGFDLPSPDGGLRVLTDHEVFRRARRLRRGRRFRGAVALESLSQLQPGDYVVHMDHGIGRFRGLEKVTVGGQDLEALAVEYAGGEVLRVPVYRLDLLERWIGETEGARPPQVHRIGGKQWKSLRRRTRAAIEKMALELLELYAARARARGHRYPADDHWQKEMESAFLYEDTPDQRQATADVKADMESSRPMDRLVCGDVGYGKTEIAIRAAFKAVQDGMQVAVLAPTTILVEQHRHTFQERLADYPVNVRALSRFRTPGEQAEIIEGLTAGSVDVVIGTHRLLSSDVRFRSLGLLVVDEEQRFGVRHKERLKELKSSVDVLTLTATPIPRTLHQSLAGLRDLTVIQTPPRDRMPIITHVLPWSDKILEDALARELDRGGQVYVLHNRLDTIHTAAERVRGLAADASVAVAHGQMKARELDSVMRRFVDGELDVLVCSSIIENGLDVPNANTLIVDGADRFGLSQLYQIRGRVGRSDRRAYCYLVVPENVSELADRRLRVLEHYTELGSGYAVALKDLEHRGAGNLLGADQSGFAHQVGLDTYLRLLQDTIDAMSRGGKATEFPDAEVSMDVPAYLGDDYVTESRQKLHFYRMLSRAGDLKGVEAIREELRDRYGPLPDSAEALLDQTSMRILGRALGVQRIFVRGREGRITFRPAVHPRLAGLEAPFADRLIDVEVRRTAPLALSLHHDGAEPLTRTLIDALATLAKAGAE